MNRRLPLLTFALWPALAGMLALAGCRKDMYDQPRYKPAAASSLFADGASARPLLPDTVSRTDPISSPTLLTGTVNGVPTDRLPLPLTAGLMLRGRERYDIYCSPCHGAGGDGDGMAVQRGFPAPPSFHEQRLHDAPIGHFFNVITRGYGVMYSYASRVAPRDRWAIAAYIRALQLSRAAPLDAVPEDARQKLIGASGAAGGNGGKP